MKARIVRYDKTGKMYLRTEIAGIVRWHYVTKEDYPHLSDMKVTWLTKLFVIDEKGGPNEENI